MNTWPSLSSLRSSTPPEVGGVITQTDCLIIGGGIAGLYALARLREAGYSALLLERDALGRGQTIASQGIIHSGLKYALTGAINETARKIAATAEQWREALEGKGPVDLSQARITTDEQHLLMKARLFGGLGSLVGRHLFGKEQVGKLPKSQWPEAMAKIGFGGQVIFMREPALDTQSLLSAFLQGHGDYIRKIPEGTVAMERKAEGLILRWDNQVIHTRQLIVTAAGANQDYAEKLGYGSLQTQERPLRMVMVKGDLPKIWAHGLKGGFRPAMTISSHETRQGETVWYIGGQVAEDGVNQNDEDLFQATKKVLADYLPKLDLSKAEWASHYVARVEGKDPQGRLPDGPVMQIQDNVIFAFPTKLTFAPLLAEQILEHMKKRDIQPGNYSPQVWQDWPRVTVADNPWDSVLWSKA